MTDNGVDVPKVLIIGASGFVGTAVVRAVTASHDMLPIACMRRSSRTLDATDVESRICDGPGVSPTATSSSPVAHTATRGRTVTGTSA